MKRFINYKKWMAGGFLFFTFSADAQKADSPAADLTHVYIVLGMAAITLVLALLTCFYVLYILRYLLVPPSEIKEKPSFNLSVWFMEKFISGKLVPVSEEHSIMLDHNYDGIVELDNRMPPWLRFLFLSTITFAVVYLAVFMVFDIGALQKEEYEQEIAIAEKLKIERNALVANNIDENSVKADTTAVAIEEGKAIYLQNCKACHGGAGEGGVGPNLTDAYWLHGGTVNDIFKTIKYGVPQKGMISWQAKLKPGQIQKVSSFILSIKDTKPANGKAPQGELALK